VIFIRPILGGDYILSNIKFPGMADPLVLKVVKKADGPLLDSNIGAQCRPL
jgi:hypothetical protein